MGVQWTQLHPHPLLFGNVTSGTTLTVTSPVKAGWTYLILGMDAYPNIQPNNGSLQVDVIGSGPSGFDATIWLIQQSQNFPGPFGWRGCWPVYNDAARINVTSSVPFAFSMWGAWVPSYLNDFDPHIGA